MRAHVVRQVSPMVREVAVYGSVLGQPVAIELVITARSGETAAGVADFLESFLARVLSSEYEALAASMGRH